MSGFARAVRIVIGLTLLFMFLTYQSDTKTTGDETRSESRLGVWFSPWFTWTNVTHATKIATEGGGSIESRTQQASTQFTTASWSWPVLGAALVVLFRPRKKNPPPGAVVAPATAPPNNPRP